MRPIDADALMERLTRKKAEVANKRYTEGFNDAILKFRSMLHSEPTLDCETVRHYGTTSFVTTEDIDKYNSRIVLDEGGKSRFCRIFYEDGETDTPKWTSVKDELPPNKGRLILTVNGHGYIRIAAFWGKNGENWKWVGTDCRVKHYNDITHWMPIPEPPKEKYK